MAAMRGSGGLGQRSPSLGGHQWLIDLDLAPKVGKLPVMARVVEFHSCERACIANVKNHRPSWISGWISSGTFKGAWPPWHGATPDRSMVVGRRRQRCGCVARDRRARPLCLGGGRKYRGTVPIENHDLCGAGGSSPAAHAIELHLMRPNYRREAHAARCHHSNLTTKPDTRELKFWQSTPGSGACQQNPTSANRFVGMSSMFA